MYGNFSGQSLSLVIGAPGYGTPGHSQHGRVYLVTINTGSGLPDKDLNLDSDADMILDGLAENGRFGTALAVVDLNNDGIDDLAVSASSTGMSVVFKVTPVQIQLKGPCEIFYCLNPSWVCNPQFRLQILDLFLR